jgi:hypothetical protein
MQVHAVLPPVSYVRYILPVHGARKRGLERSLVRLPVVMCHALPVDLVGLHVHACTCVCIVLYICVGE